MTTAELSPPARRAAGIHWDLAPLVADAQEAKRRLEAVLERCRGFQERYQGRVATLDANELAELLVELAVIDNELSRVASYSHLRESTDITGEENRDLSTAVERSLVEAGNALRFFELEWIAMPEEQASALAAAPQVARDRHYLEAMRRFAAHTLSAPEERMLSERGPAAVSAWQTLFSQVTSTLEVTFDSGEGAEPHTIDRLLAYVRDPRREVRMAALACLFEALEPHAPVLAHCYDTLVGDRLAMDGLRHYRFPMEATHLRNELPGHVVDGMLVAVEERYPLAQRWFRAKAASLGLERLNLADQYAPLGASRTVLYPEARELIDSSFRSFSTRVADLVEGFFADQRIDAEPRAGKRGGAFCSPVAQDAQPYVLMNFTDRMDDVMTLAHELGHGMHFTLAGAEQTALSAHTGLALAEIPSTFAELVAFDHLVGQERDPDTRRALLCERVEGSFATIFRQTVLTRYEQVAYAMRADGQALTAARLSEAWLTANRAYYEDSLEIPEGYGLGWSYIPHFISTRFYTYAYVFAHLVTLALYARYRATGEAFVEPYLGFLASGGSLSPTEALARLRLDVDDASVWSAGFAELERMVGEAERELTAR